MCFDVNNENAGELEPLHLVNGRYSDRVRPLDHIVGGYIISRVRGALEKIHDIGKVLPRIHIVIYGIYFLYANRVNLVSERNGVGEKCVVLCNKESVL